MRDPQAEPSDLIRSVSRALRVLEAVGQSERGLTVKQIARRCQLTVATTYHLVRTLAYEGYVIRREDGTYVVGLEISDRFRELVLAFRGSGAVVDGLRRAAAETGYTHVLARFIGGRAAITAVAEGPRSPHVEDFVPGFDDAAHATSHGKTLLATLTPDQRHAVEVLLTSALQGLMFSLLVQLIGVLPGLGGLHPYLLSTQFNAWQGLLRQPIDWHPIWHAAWVCPLYAVPATELMTSARVVRTRLLATAHGLTDALKLERD